MTDQLTALLAAMRALMESDAGRASARRPRRRGEAGMEVIQVVILSAAFAAIAIALGAIIRAYVIDSAKNLPKQQQGG